MVLGRNAGCDVVLADQTVSSRHAEVVPVPGGYALRDLDSSNGSWVGSARVPPGTLHTLHHGDGVRLGRTFMTYVAGDEITLGGEPGAKAVLIWPDGRSETPIHLDVTSIGRASTSEIVVPTPVASRLHAQIVRASGGGRYIYDMGSTNGTRVNGIRIVDSHELVDGDQITIGRLTYTYRQVGGR